MPYGDLAAQAVQRFAVMEDLDRHQCTIEEREEYEPHIRQGTVVYAGVDYERILREVEREADVILWLSKYEASFGSLNNTRSFVAAGTGHVVLGSGCPPRSGAQPG